MFALTKIQYRGKLFIDCTGDGWLGYYAGAKYRFGREDENFMRKRTHFFPETDAKALRIRVYRTWGDPSARITEVRAALE